MNTKLKSSLFTLIFMFFIFICNIVVAQTNPCSTIARSWSVNGPTVHGIKSININSSTKSASTPGAYVLKGTVTVSGDRSLVFNNGTCQLGQNSKSIVALSFPTAALASPIAPVCIISMAPMPISTSSFKAIVTPSENYACGQTSLGTITFNAD